MNAARTLLVLSLSLVGTSIACGDYQIVWSTIDGGGGQSAGGQYVLTGTIGQLDASHSEGGSYQASGGFWPGGPLCFVDFPDFARFAQYWWQADAGLPADLSGDGAVDFVDVGLFLYDWLCPCPYNWPLR
jgi:hypothetical protein